MDEAGCAIVDVLTLALLSLRGLETWAIYRLRCDLGLKRLSRQSCSIVVGNGSAIVYEVTRFHAGP